MPLKTPGFLERCETRLFYSLLCDEKSVALQAMGVKLQWSFCPQVNSTKSSMNDVDLAHTFISYLLALGTLRFHCISGLIIYHNLLKITALIPNNLH